MFVVSDDDDIDGMQDAGVALVRAYNYITSEVDSHSAFDAVIAVSPRCHHAPAREDRHFSASAWMTAALRFSVKRCSTRFLWAAC